MKKNPIMFMLLLLVAVMISCSSDSDNQEEGGIESTYVNENEEEPQEPVIFNMALCGTWKIVSYGTREERNDLEPGGRLAKDGRFFTMTLHSDGRLGGYTSERWFQGRFVTNEKEFHFVSFGTTRRTDDIEKPVYNYVADRIPEVKSYELDENDNLLLYYSDTEYLQLVKIAEAAVEPKNPYTGRWELKMNILYNDTTYLEPGSGYIEFTKDGACRYPWIAKRLKFSESTKLTYTYDDEFIYFILEGAPRYLAFDHYELNEDSTQLRMWNLQYGVDFIDDPKIPISVYEKQ